MEIVLDTLKTRYAKFDGRARRKEYWMFFLFVMIVAVVLNIVAGILGGPRSPLGMLVFGIYGLFLLAILIPGIALGFRRLHDTNRSAWWMLIGLVPFIGGLVLLVFYVLPGTPGPNQFGPDPIAGSENVAEAFS